MGTTGAQLSQAGLQHQLHVEAFELDVRQDGDLAVVPADLPGPRLHHDVGGLEGEAPQRQVIRVDHRGDVPRQPRVDLPLDVTGIGGAADVVAHDALDVVREPGDGE